jgi:hypothetical protein
MEYCSLDDAFGGTAAIAGQEARRQERKKAKRCKGPAMAFLDPDGAYAPDPDRPSVVKQTPLPAMNSSTGLREHVPLEADVGTTESFQGEKDKSSSSSETQNSTGFFGKDPAESYASFSHVIGDAKEYRLQPDFSDAFRKAGSLNSAGASAALPTPSVRDVWKPLTPGGARSSFFDALPPEGGGGQVPGDSQALHNKLDKIFSRLDELEATRTGDSQNAQTEVLLFIMSGIFVLFLTDLAVRKGGNM